MPIRNEECSSTSKDSVKQMFGKMGKDTDLKGKYARLMQAHQKDSEAKMAEKLPVSLFQKTICWLPALKLWIKPTQTRNCRTATCLT